MDGGRNGEVVKGCVGVSKKRRQVVVAAGLGLGQEGGSENVWQFWLLSEDHPCVRGVAGRRAGQLQKLQKLTE